MRLTIRRLRNRLRPAAVVLAAALVAVALADCSGSSSPAASSTAVAGSSPAAGSPTVGAAAPVASCAHRVVWLCEDFEGTPVGAVPAGWSATGPVTVSATQAREGRHSLEVGVIDRGPRIITTSLTGLGLLAGEQWGRIFFKVGVPVPYSATHILHSTMVAESAVSPLRGDPIEVRPVGIEGSHDGRPDFQFLYNVQPGSKRREFATLSPFNWSYDSAWHCAEWHLSSQQQSYDFFIDGREVTSIRLDNGPGTFAGTEIPPTYRSISIGWTNYRTAAVNGFRGFQAWIDDVAVNSARIGCG
ncbi:MAG: hypothetical protein ACQSGP_00895 [Frankia sp.]